MVIDESYQKHLDRFKTKKKEFKQRVKALKKCNSGQLDQWFLQCHREVFQEVDCLKCTACCRGLGPLLKERDIANLAKAQRMKSAEFIDRFLRLDEDGDYVFRQIPCPFLDAQGLCLFYDQRPDACRRYPHSDQRKMRGRLNTLLKDGETCPAVVLIIEKVCELAEARR